MMSIIVIAACMLAGVSLQGVEDAILFLSGASVIEELSDEEIEKYRGFVSRPLDINAAGFSRLKSCGLLTDRQAASLIQSRSRSGDILSWTELSMLDGFSAEYADALRHFVVIKSSRSPGQREDMSPRYEMMVRGMVKPASDEAEWAAGLKLGFSLGERAGLAFATRNTYGDSRIGLGTISAVWYGRRRVGKIVSGDMALRFGQGLAVWTGFSLSGLSSIQSYRRSPTGISQTSSFNSEHKGVGVDFNFVPKSRNSVIYTISAAYSISGGLPVLNVSRTGKTTTFGLTATSSAVAADFRLGLPSFSLFGEGCLDYSLNASGVCGAIWIPEYGRKVGIVARYAGNKLQPAAGYESTLFKLNFEGKVDYSKRTEMYKLSFVTADSVKFCIPASGSLALKPSVRLAGKWKPQESVPFRTDLRLDLSLAKSLPSGEWSVNWRSDLEYSKAFSWQTYLEGGYSIHPDSFLSFVVHARAGVFNVDNWDDRIYVYERDLPGTFTCPALYGRGVRGFVVGTGKFRGGKGSGRRHFSHAISLKASVTGYFIDKPASLELKLQYSLIFPA